MKRTNMVKTFKVYTDGSCFRKKDGIGGWAYYGEWKGEPFHGTGGVRTTTNNRMELTAALEGVARIVDDIGSGLKLHERKVVVVSDSKYVVLGYTYWLDDWLQHDWITKNGRTVKNQDLWNRFLDLETKCQIKMRWVKGHSGNPNNDYVDKLSRSAALSLIGVTTGLA